MYFWLIFSAAISPLLDTQFFVGDAEHKHQKAKRYASPKWVAFFGPVFTAVINQTTQVGLFTYSFFIS
jgi:hypothetical protein